MNDIKRTIESVLDLKTGDEVEASVFFAKPEAEIFEVRRSQQTAFDKKSIHEAFVCYECKQLISISGSIIDINETQSGISDGQRTKQRMHFKHFKNDVECSIKNAKSFTEEEILRMKYNGAKESLLHQRLKYFIADRLNANAESIGDVIGDVYVEKIVKDAAISKAWRKPDVQCNYKNHKLVFELQLSTTFLSEIVGRETFYKEHKTFILWVFDHFNLEENKQRFTQKDVYYGNKRNVFVLTQKAQDESIESEDLILRCNYQVPQIDSDNNIAISWQSKYVSLDELTFDVETYKVYYFDSDKAIKDLELVVENKKAALEEAAKKRREAQALEAAKERVEREKLQREQALEEERAAFLRKEWKKSENGNYTLWVDNKNITIYKIKNTDKYRCVINNQHGKKKFDNLEEAKAIVFDGIQYYKKRNQW